MITWQTKDKDITTESAIMARIYSIKCQREIIENRECRDSTMQAFNRKHEKIKKLNERLDAFSEKLRNLRKVQS